MHIIVIGCGKVGSKLAMTLAEEGHDVVIVDSDSKSFKMIDPSFNGITVTGVPIDQDVLKHAGIETADALAAVTPFDNVNIMVCQVAKEIFKLPRVIARVFNPSSQHVFHQFGLETICPTNITVDVICSNILGESSITNHTIGNNTFSFTHEKVSKESVGKKLGTVKIKKGLFLFGVIKNDNFVFADPSLTVDASTVLVLSKKVDL